MNNKQVLIKAQRTAGYTATGYRTDIDEDVLNNICEMMWKHSVNLGYSVMQWLEQVHDVLGKIQFLKWNDEINEFKHIMINNGRTFVCLGTRYCS